MATWIAHMRIAENFMKKYKDLNNVDFLVGNIGPDCGVPNEDWSGYTPGKAVTHWHLNGKKINAEDFRQKYLIDKNKGFLFFLGYYFHLITDIEWSKLYAEKKKTPLYSKGLAANSGFINTIKKDWYGQDMLYLQNNPDCILFSIFSKIESFENIYFDFYPENAFIRQIKYITQFYFTEYKKEDPEREFPFLTKEEMDIFVNETTDLLKTQTEAYFERFFSV